MGPASNLLLPFLIALSLGLFFGIGVFAVLREATKGSRAARIEGFVAQVNEAQLDAARAKRAKGSLTFRLGLALTPAVSPMANRLCSPAQREELSEYYARAGFPGGLREDEVLAFSYMQAFGLGVALGVALAAAGILLGFPMLLVPALLCPLLAAAGPGISKSSYQSEAIKREKKIIRVFPYVLDLLVLTMKSGASLTIAMERVCSDYRGHPVGDEFRAVLTDIELGSTSRQAFENFGKRVPVKVVTTFVDDILQAEELGQPVAEALERLSDRVRVRRIQDARATAGNAKVKVLIPSVLVMFAALIMLFSPFIMRWQTGTFGDQGTGNTTEGLEAAGE